MEAPELPEWLKVSLGIIGGAFAWGLVAWLSKEWIVKSVIEPIQELKTKVDKQEEKIASFTDRISSFIFKIIHSHDSHLKGTSQEITNMSKLFTEATQHTSQAKMESHEALQKVNVLEKTTDKLVKIATAVHEKNKSLETEVKKISEDMVMIKDKVGVKKNED